jgi:hypothetical protein
MPRQLNLDAVSGSSSQQFLDLILAGWRCGRYANAPLPQEVDQHDPFTVPNMLVDAGNRDAQGITLLAL